MGDGQPVPLDPGEKERYRLYHIFLSNHLPPLADELTRKLLSEKAKIKVPEGVPIEFRKNIPCHFFVWYKPDPFDSGKVGRDELEELKRRAWEGIAKPDYADLTRIEPTKDPSKLGRLYLCLPLPSEEYHDTDLKNPDSKAYSTIRCCSPPPD